MPQRNLTAEINKESDDFEKFARLLSRIETDLPNCLD